MQDSKRKIGEIGWVRGERLEVRVCLSLNRVDRKGVLFVRESKITIPKKIHRRI
jgi:hypothetical protein